MPNPALSDALSTVTGYAQALDHTLETELEGWTDFHGRTSTGYHFRTDNGVSYLVYGNPITEYLIATSHFDIVAAVRNQMSEPDIERWARKDVAYRNETPEGHDEEPLEVIAPRAVLDSVDDEKMEDALREVREVLETDGTIYEPAVSENRSLVRYFVHRKLFPYHDELSIREFADTVNMLTRRREKAHRVFFDKIELPEFEVEDSEEAGEFESGASDSYTTAGRGIQ